MKISLPTKKVRRINANHIASMDKATTTSDRKVATPQKTKFPVPTTEVEEHVEQEKPIAEEPSPPPAEAIVESPTEEISKRKRRKQLMPVAFRLPRPCKVTVCKPDICCRGKLSIRYGVVQHNG